ncbi:hypothetical protein GGS23DRAFT_607688 [Durotheca rogersii]|uniref:uncharacterized protein n=1 Tax=Durotheca rogersii TaxID=419775 RepID=UPI00222016E3|nr:uncharacterized protein GGS23DRAFT_607688 [Durotheca rogersii]KAI5858289.1 hypothetical protein GGS23DRAFT_607688 [Durotheca rogersii]
MAADPSDEPPRQDAPPEDTPRDPDAADAAALEQARKFLGDESVRNASVEKKTEFLKSKGFTREQLERLSGELEPQPHQHQHAADAAPSDEKEARQAWQEKEVARQAAPAATASDDASESASEPDLLTPPTTAATSPTSGGPAPIITYPEFLTKAARPPPLITPSRLGNILAVSGSVWALLYGTARFAVGPMVDALNDARGDYYAHVGERLGDLVERLEGAASEVPYPAGRPLLLLSRRRSSAEFSDATGDCYDEQSTFSDPTELFHRDIGTQTSPVLRPADSAAGAGASASASGRRRDSSASTRRTEISVDSQVRRLAAVRASLRELGDMSTRRAEASADLHGLLREIRDDVDALGSGGPGAVADFSSLYGRGAVTDPDDEVKRAKDAIRSVKGMFLSARSFPAAAAGAR